MNDSGKICVLVLGLLASACVAQPVPTPPTNLKAPTYYIAANVSECNSELIRVNGVSNLPPGALLRIDIGELKGDAAITTYGEAINQAIVGADGRFEVEIRPKSRMTFRPRLVGLVSFETAWKDQPTSVTAIVGSHGERLGNLHNPQLFQRSGECYGLSTPIITGFCPKLEHDRQANDQRPTTND